MSENNLQKVEFLGKWLWILFLMVVPSTLAEIMTDKNIIKWFPFWDIPGQILEILCLGAYGFVLLKLSAENVRYRTAGICVWISGGIGIVITLLSGGVEGSSGTLFFTLPAVVVSLVGEYYEYKAHSEVLRDVDICLSEKWDILWKWNFGIFLGLFGCIVVMMLVPVLGLFVFIAIGIASIVVSILELVYLYRTAKVFKDRLKE